MRNLDYTVFIWPVINCKCRSQNNPLSERTKKLRPEFSIGKGEGDHDKRLSRRSIFLKEKKTRRLTNNIPVYYDTRPLSNDRIGAHSNHNRFKTEAFLGETALSFDRVFILFMKLKFGLINCRQTWDFAFFSYTKVFLSCIFSNHPFCDFHAFEFIIELY